MAAVAPPTPTSDTHRLDGARVKVWDPLVRIFHWSVVGGVLANLTVFEHEKTPHTYVGYAVLAALAIRLAWGVIGPRHARFASFVVGPRGLWRYARAMLAGREPRYLGHNPAGAAMIVILMILLAAIGTTGWMMGLDRFWGVGWVEALHKTAANLLIGAVVLHVLGAVFESVRHRENLPLAMITGYKRAPTGTDIDHAPVVG